MDLGAAGDAKVDDEYRVGLLFHLAMSRQARENGCLGHLVHTPVGRRPQVTDLLSLLHIEPPKAKGSV